MLKVDCDEVHFAAIGTGGRPLRRENYAAATLVDIDHVTHDIAAREPCGRIALLTGPTGTGKTHIIRGILDTATEARFVVLQPGDLKSFLDASPLSALSDFARGEASGHPIVLVIEDADGCLVPRGADNISLISALLNLSDGLVGAMFDIRVLATTNAKTVEVDSAILRPGRLCRRIDVPPLVAEHATKLLAGLLDAAPTSPFRKSATLAEVYAAARERPKAV
jgi:ATP-dependent 26S proteasome regulatory subunit